MRVLVQCLLRHMTPLTTSHPELLSSQSQVATRSIWPFAKPHAVGLIALGERIGILGNTPNICAIPFLIGTPARMIREAKDSMRLRLLISSTATRASHHRFNQQPSTCLAVSRMTAVGNCVFCAVTLCHAQSIHEISVTRRISGLSVYL
jgi:hypothetical protein